MGKEPINFTPYDTADYLESEEDVAAYLEAAAEEGNPEFMADALKIAERARAKWQK